MNDRPNIADQLAEPADGTRLVIRDGGGIETLIWRDDEAAEDCTDGASYLRWFATDNDDDPTSWQEALTYAVAVYPVDAKPLAELPA